MANIHIERGDSVKFGAKWCKKYGRTDLTNKVVKLNPQWFENDNGLYCYDEECPGIWNERDKEADSIYHLFGNHFENFMDCELIKGTDEDKAEYQKIVRDKGEAETKNYEKLTVEMDIESA